MKTYVQKGNKRDEKNEETESWASPRRHGKSLNGHNPSFVLVRKDLKEEDKKVMKGPVGASSNSSMK